VDDAQHILDALLPQPSIRTGHLQTELDVIGHGHIREQGVLLENHANVALIGVERSHILAINNDAPPRRFLESGNHAEDGGLAAAAGAEKGDKLPFFDLQIKVLHRDRRPKFLA